MTLFKKGWIVILKKTTTKTTNPMTKLWKKTNAHIINRNFHFKHMAAFVPKPVTILIFFKYNYWNRKDSINFLIKYKIYVNGWKLKLHKGKQKLIEIIIKLNNITY